MNRISETEFARICRGISDDREIIIKHNPLGDDDEILMWMLMSCLVSYLSLDESEMPCFPGRPSAAVYRDAIDFILAGRMAKPFDAAPYLDTLK